MKVMTVVGTRPEIIKLSRVIPELDKHFEHVLVHTGQNYLPVLNDVFFKELKIRHADFDLTVHDGLTAVPFVANLLAMGDKLLKEQKPDALLILGDTNSSLIAYAAKRHHIPIFHMEAGNRCFDQRTPEEINRKLVDHLSDINMVYTEHARRNLLAEGVKPDTIFKTGSPMREVINHYGTESRCSTILQRLEVQAKKYFVFSTHREENVADGYAMHNVINAASRLSNIYNHPVIFIVHPRHAAYTTIGPWGAADGVHTIAPPGFLDYLELQRNAACVLSDSGTLTEEAALAGFPAVMIRHAHERPEGMDAGVTVMCDPDFGCLRGAVGMAMTQPRGAVPDDYWPRHLVSEQVARIIRSYTPFVNRTVWHTKTNA